MTDIPKFIENLLPTKVLEKLYDDAGAGAAQELGKVGVDLVKTARLFLAPFQLTAAFQDRFERIVTRIASKVPEEQRVNVPGEIVGPAIRQMQFLEEDNPLWQMFEELLKCSVDIKVASKVHPSFVHIISQLSRDEAVILYRLRQGDFSVVDTLDLNLAKNRFENRVIEKSDIPENELTLPSQVSLYYSHLESLSLVNWPVESEDYLKTPEGVQTGIRRYSAIKLTEFGCLFVEACIPKEGFQSVDR